MNTFEQTYQRYYDGLMSKAAMVQWLIDRGDSPVMALFQMEIDSKTNERALVWIRAMNHFDHHNFAAFDMAHDSLYKGVLYD